MEEPVPCRPGAALVLFCPDFGLPQLTVHRNSFICRGKDVRQNPLDTFDAFVTAQPRGDLSNDIRLMSYKQTGGNLQVMPGPASEPEASIRKALAGQRWRNIYIITIYKLDQLFRQLLCQAEVAERPLS